MISLQHVTKEYETAAGAFTALRDVNLEIQAAEMVAIVGKSGSGKSTLLNMLGGIDRPSTGSVLIGDTPIERLTENRLAIWRGRNVGFVFQFFQLLPTLTIAENVMLPMDFCGTVPPRQRRKRALDLLERVAIVEQADKLPSALSGGQLQRAAIARALANQPVVILADEPTGNLDSQNASSILSLLRDLASQGATVVVATHERDIASVVDRRVEIVDGRITSCASDGSGPSGLEKAV